MNKKILNIILVLIFGILLITLTGCGDTETVSEFKNRTFKYNLEETDYTWDEATKKVMSGVKWEDYTEDEILYIKITGTEKSTGKEIELVYKNYNDTTWAINELNVDGESNFTYFETLFESVGE